METTNNPTIQEGWTLRDEFAMRAMQGILTSPIYERFSGNNSMHALEFVAEQAYLIADAMLKQRKDEK